MVTGLNGSIIKAKKFIYENLKKNICCRCRHMQYKNDISFNIIADVNIRNTKMTSVSILLWMLTSAIKSK